MSIQVIKYLAIFLPMVVSQYTPKPQVLFLPAKIDAVLEEASVRLREYTVNKMKTIRYVNLRRVLFNDKLYSCYKKVLKDDEDTVTELFTKMNELNMDKKNKYYIATNKTVEAINSFYENENKEWKHIRRKLRDIEAVLLVVKKLRVLLRFRNRLKPRRIRDLEKETLYW